MTKALLSPRSEARAQPRGGATSPHRCFKSLPGKGFEDYFTFVRVETPLDRAVRGVPTRGRHHRRPRIDAVDHRLKKGTTQFRDDTEITTRTGADTASGFRSRVGEESHSLNKWRRVHAVSEVGLLPAARSRWSDHTSKVVRKTLVGKLNANFVFFRLRTTRRELYSPTPKAPGCALPRPRATPADIPHTAAS